MAAGVFRKVVSSNHKRLIKSTNSWVFFNKIDNRFSIQHLRAASTSATNINKSDSGPSGSEHVIKSPHAQVQIPNVSLPELLFENINSWYNKTAIVCSVTNRQYTYEELRLKSRNLAKSLMQKLKLQKGDVVAMLLPNTPEYPIILLAGLQSGIILTTLNPLYTADEISRQLIDADAKAIFTWNSMFKVVSDATKLLKKNIPIITIKTQVSESTERGSINFTELTDVKYDNGDLIFPNADDIAVMPYSSGTTGLPKGVELTHRNLVSNITQVSNFNLHIPTTETYQEAIPAVLPMFHIYGHTNLTLYPIYFGMKIITLPKFTPELFTSVLEEHNPGLLFIVPPIVNFMNTSPLFTTECYKSLRTVFSGAAPLGPLDEAKLLQKAGKDVNVLQGYGLTETSPIVSSLSIERKKEINVMGSVGDPIPNTLVKIVSPDNPTGKLLKPYENGELVVKGPQVMKGYHNKPEETANTIVDGWLRTGDLAYYDKNNFLFVTDRLKELIKVKGFQVAPAELEELIRDHPQVQDAAVIGIPHENYGEVPRAYVVPKKGAKIDDKKLNEYLTPKVTSYKLLRGGVSVVDSIPKNAAGKILRKNLKKLYEEQKI